MICKFFVPQKGGDGCGEASLDYLLDPKRVEDGTAKVLKGSPDLTRELIKSLNYKQKATVGCLSFEEKDIDEQQKKEIMESFEEALLTPAMVGRYNILWVQHTDKGRLELNFVIPRIDLERQKNFEPYFHKADVKRIDLWGDYVNLSYGFTDPKDPSKQRDIKNINPHSKSFPNHQSLDDHFRQLVLEGVVKSRSELLEYIKTELKDIVEITRQGEEYLGLKFFGDKKAARYKGGIYKNGDYSDSLREENERKQRDNRERAEARSPENLKDLRRKLEKLIDSKAEYNRKKYKLEAGGDSKEYSEGNHTASLEICTVDRDHSDIDLSIFVPFSAPPQANAQVMETPESGNNNTLRSDRGDQTNREFLHNNSKGLEDDNRRYLESITRRKREFERRKQQIIELESKNAERARELAERKQRDLEEENRIREIYSRTRELNKSYARENQILFERLWAGAEELAKRIRERFRPRKLGLRRRRR